MHIHSHAINPAATGLHSAATAEKAASAQRASDTRRKLLKGDFELEGELSGGEWLQAGSWAEEESGRRGHGQADAPKQNRASERARSEEEQGGRPLSIWA